MLEIKILFWKKKYHLHWKPCICIYLFTSPQSSSFCISLSKSVNKLISLRKGTSTQKEEAPVF